MNDIMVSHFVYRLEDFMKRIAIIPIENLMTITETNQELHKPFTQLRQQFLKLSILCHKIVVIRNLKKRKLFLLTGIQIYVMLRKKKLMNVRTKS